LNFKIWKNEDKFLFSQKSLACPKCDLDMVKIDYDKINVEIDYCPKCRGVWLDENSDFKLFQYEMKKIMKNE